MSVPPASFSSVRVRTGKGRMMKWGGEALASPLPFRRLRILQVTSRHAKYVAGGPKRQRNHSCETTQTNRNWVRLFHPRHSADPNWRHLCHKVKT